MTIFRSSLLFVLLLAGCGEPASEKFIAPAIGPEQQAERAQKCMGEIESWRARGVWIHGGVEPAVNRDAWGSLSGKDQQRIADVAACIAAGGTFEPKEVQIVSEGFKVPIETMHSNNSLFSENYLKGAQ